MKFTFKKQIATGRYRSFEKDQTEIKLNKKMCGLIDETENGKYRMSFMVLKDKPDNNPNCEWKWVRVKPLFNSEEEARQWVTKLSPQIQRWNLYLQED